MSIDSINQLSNIAALIRSQVGSRGATTSRRSAITESKQSKTGKREADSTLEQKLITRLGAVLPDDPQRRRKAFLAFIEAVLLDELGDRLVNDPGFYQLAETVGERMLAEPSLSEPIASAIDRMLMASD
ncbi:hypothetical protein [Chitinimonas sp. BJB300]|uniref:hypothetical protein n=1 Tax=Chitinimonas sp. BJB300 TaxID=1559339 RepID=UPI000C0EA11E|nr:hypothetical protein [Chitinimonas sp. BJB300]PHV12863.1 hypothetical protein CSQ89_03465 [Chitinimonas sp. BJB300]TSJ86105.1 hypothetical protein FG002_016375 [Chitinimonas sp. BJB300]